VIHSSNDTTGMVERILREFVFTRASISGSGLPAEEVIDILGGCISKVEGWLNDYITAQPQRLQSVEEIAKTERKVDHSHS